MSQTYIDHFKSTFSYVPALSFNEWAMNMGINNDTSDILYANSSTGSSNSNTRVNCEEEKVEGKKNCKKKSWSKLEVAVLVNSWKHLYKEIETFKQPSAWLKLKELVDKQGQPKFLIQIKSK